MKKFSNQYKTENTGEQTGNFWLYLLQWLRLLTLSFTRVKELLSGIFFHDPDIKKMIRLTITYKKIDNKKTLKMKSGNRKLKWEFTLLLIICSTVTFAQVGSLTQTGNQTVCLGSQPYGVVPTAGSSYSWSIVPLVGGNGTITSGQGTNLVDINWTTPGTATLQIVETNSTNCIGDPVNIIVTVLPNNTINLTSAAGTDAQAVCINTAITNITYATTGATGATFSGLPAGVTGSWSGNVVTISGSPSTTTGSPFTYTITLTGGCSVVTKTGTITVTPDNTITLSSAAGTDAQTVCINTAITNITYATTGVTGATFSGLPAGVTGSWSGNVVTISGSPTTTTGSPFTYTITLTGGCSVVTKTGTITVIPSNTITLTSAAGTDAQAVCINTAITNITYATTGATGATFSGLPAGVTGSWSGNVVTISGSPTTTTGSPFTYTITLTGGCSVVTKTGTVTVYDKPATSPIYHN